MTPRECQVLRRAAGLKQEEMAAELGVAQETLSRWETGRLRISRRTELAIIAVLRPRVLEIKAALEAFDREGR